MRNFARINNYFNRQEAWKDWNKIYVLAVERGFRIEALAMWPDQEAGWHKIDKQIAKLREFLKSKESVQS